MAITVKHSKVSTIPDGDDSSVVRPSDWNDDHVLTGTIPVANGGTGAATLTGYVKGTGTTAMTAAATIPNTDITGLGTASTKDAGAANGVATLDAGGKVPVSELPAAVLGALSYQGTWDASTNTPTLTSSVGTKGYYYVVSVAGNTDLNGITDWQIGDWAVFNGLVWQKVDNTDAGGDVVGPASATDNAIARYDTTTGKLLQNSLVIVDDTGSVTGVNALTAQSLTVNNNATLGSSNTDSLDVRARISSDLDPETNNAKDIGTNGRNWRDGFFGRTVHTVNLELTGTTSFDGAQGTSGQVLTSAGTGNTPTWTTPTVGDVVGPSSATDNAVARFDSTTGKLIQNSAVTIGDSGNTVISVTDNSNAALRITQLGTGNALLVEDSTNPDGSPFVIDASGICIQGTTALTTVPNYGGTASAPLLQTVSTAGSGVGYGGHLFAMYSASTAASGIIASKSRGATVGTQTVVNSGDKLFSINAQGSDGTGFIRSADISFEVDGTPGTNDMPGRLVFSTTPDGASSPTERMRITSTGAVAFAGASNYGTSGQVLTSSGNSAPTWTTPTTGTVTSVGGTGTVNGLTLTGTVTTSGNLTLGGTLNLSSPPVIGNTTPAAITGTTITATTYVGVSGGIF